MGIQQYVHQLVSSLTPDLKLTGASATFTALTLLPDDLHKQEECKEWRVIGNCSPKFLFFFKNNHTFCTGPIPYRKEDNTVLGFPSKNVCITGLGSKASTQLTDSCSISGWQYLQIFEEAPLEDVQSRWLPDAIQILELSSCFFLCCHLKNPHV